MTAGNAGKGRAAGSRNRRTEAHLALAENGETTCAFALRVMRDVKQPPELRVHAAKLAAPFIHSRPQPEARMVVFTVPEEFGGAASLLSVHATLLRATAAGEIALEDAKDISAMLETHRRLVETVEMEERIVILEKAAR